MKFTTKQRINANKMCVVLSPSLLHDRRLIPRVVRIETLNPPGPARDIQVKIMTGSVEIENNQEAYYNVSDSVSLIQHYKALQRVGDLTMFITNKFPENREFQITVEYEKCDGFLMHQERFDSQYDKVFTNVAAVGYCTRLVLSFNRPIARLQIKPTTECDPEDEKFEWLSTQVISPCEIMDPETCPRPVYIIADEDMEQLASFMDFIQLIVEDDAPPEVKDRSNLQLYVLAYGFPKK